MSEKEEFDIEYYFKVIELFYDKAVEFDILYDKFFELQEKSKQLTTEQYKQIENNLRYKTLESKMDKLANIINKIK